MAVYRRLATRFRCAPDELADRRAAVLPSSMLSRTTIPRSARSTSRWPRRGPSSIEPPAGSRPAGAKSPATSAGSSRNGSNRWDWKPLSLSVTVETRALDQDPSGGRPARSGAGPRRDAVLGEPGRGAPAVAQDRVGRRARQSHARRQDRAGGRRSRAHARLRRDRRRRRRPARLGAGQGARRAGAPPSGHLRDSPPPDGQPRRSSLGHPQAGRPRPVTDHHHAVVRLRASRRARGDAPGRLGCRRNTP